MRLAFSIDLPEWFSFINVRHAHSHTALLGWLFAAFFLSIIHVWECSWVRYRWIFIALQVCVLGMTLTFPFTGYALGSIAFSTAHILLSYMMIWMLWQDSKATNGLSKWLLRSALIFLLVASFGTLSLGPMMAAYKGTALYYGAIQWYLHFMFNGWMIYALLAVMFKVIEKRGITYSLQDGKKFFYLLTIATILTYALAVTWSTPHPIIFYINSLGVVLQLIALFYFVKLLKPISEKALKMLKPQARKLLFLSLAAFALKIIIQAAVVIPFIAMISYTIKNFVVGFIHLLMLGCLTLFVLSYIIQEVKLNVSKTGTFILLLGIVGTEILLFTQGLLFWIEKGFMGSYYELMTLFSLILTVGVIWITLSLKKI